MTVKHRGMPGHFVAARHCCYHACAEIDGKIRVSTVGCYHPGNVAPYERSDENREPIGCDRLYETMVFGLGPDGDVADWTELDMAGYQTEAEADDGHNRMIAKWTESVRALRGGRK